MREFIVLQCPVDGKFGEWFNDGKCSKLCGPGAQLQRRRCDSPPPDVGGKDCEGDRVQTIACKEQDVSIDT